MTKVKKRDGAIVEFDRDRIYNAIGKAMKKVNNDNYDLATNITNYIQEALKNSDFVSVEEIQNLVEEQLMKSGASDVAREYISYRNKRDIARSAKTMELFKEIVNAEPNEVTRENANMNADTPAGMMMKFASEASKKFTSLMLLKPDAVDAYINNYVYFHDLDYYPTKSTTCIHHPLDKILEKGFRAGHGASRPAKRIETASILGCISMETAQNEQHGGQSIPAFDYYLAPFVKKTFQEELKQVGELLGVTTTHLMDYQPKEYLECGLEELEGDDKLIQFAINKTVRRVHQSMEAFIHNMNTIHSRGGNQVVFSSINYGTDTTPEGRCIIREILLSTEQGVGNGETALFPIQIWKKKRGVNYLPTDPNYDLYLLACKVSAKRFFPTFLNLDAKFNQNEKWREDDPKRYNYELATMGCRTRVYENRFGEKSCIGRGNLSFSTVNIVKLALEAKNNSQSTEDTITEFFKLLDKYLDITAEQLYDRFKFQGTATAKQFPLLMSSLWKDGDTLKPDDYVKEVLKHGTLSIGFIGLAECLKALLGVHHGESEEAQELGIKIVKHMREKCNEYSEKYNLNYSLLATPAEGLSGKFVKKDREKFGIIEGVTDKDYYTNSNHIPVYYKCTASHKARIEAPYHALCNGGHIFYVELDGDATHNPVSIMAVVDLMDKYDIGYGAVNHARSRCLDCGFENADKDLNVCPKCGGEHIDTLQRITGYLVGTTNRWNKAKLAELRDRVTHNCK